MDVLPYIDDHSRPIQATPERTWEAVVQYAQERLTRAAPAPFVLLWGLKPNSGFAISERIAPSRLALCGQHRFARYELAFEIAQGPESVMLSARTRAEFPGVSGALYRALVIGSGGHGRIVRRMLKQIASFAESGR